MAEYYINPSDIENTINRRLLPMLFVDLGIGRVQKLIEEVLKIPRLGRVPLHELCHIAEHNHSGHFWRLLTQGMPNWKEMKGKLDGMAALYLNE